MSYTRDVLEFWLNVLYVAFMTVAIGLVFVICFLLATIVVRALTQ